MRYLAIIALAGLLAACDSGGDRGVDGQGNPVECRGATCLVEINIVGTGADAKIVAIPDKLAPLDMGVNIRFQVIAKGWEFVKPASEAIEFKDSARAAEQFTLVQGGPRLIVVIDKNDLPGGEDKEFAYNIRLKNVETGEILEVDPMIINV